MVCRPICASQRLTMDVLLKKTLLQMEEKSFRLSCRRFYGDRKNGRAEINNRLQQNYSKMWLFDDCLNFVFLSFAKD